MVIRRLFDLPFLTSILRMRSLLLPLFLLSRVWSGSRSSERTAVDRSRALVEADTFLRRLWMKYALHGVARSDNHSRLNLAYLVPDPWKLDTETEHARFRWTSERLEQAFGRPKTILEVGCGEGLQSEYFARQCDQLTGLDVSARAVARARRRLPQAHLLVGELNTQAWADETGRFDVVVACEVIHYMSDVPAFLANISRLGRHCLLTYYASAELEPFVRALPNVTMDKFAHGDCSWHCATWTSSR